MFGYEFEFFGHSGDHPIAIGRDSMGMRCQPLTHTHPPGTSSAAPLQPRGTTLWERQPLHHNAVSQALGLEILELPLKPTRANEGPERMCEAIVGGKKERKEWETQQSPWPRTHSVLGSIQEAEPGQQPCQKPQLPLSQSLDMSCSFAS
jgi:hypothetical protein